MTFAEQAIEAYPNNDFQVLNQAQQGLSEHMDESEYARIRNP